MKRKIAAVLCMALFMTTATASGLSAAEDPAAGEVTVISEESMAVSAVQEPEADTEIPAEEQAVEEQAAEEQAVEEPTSEERAAEEQPAEEQTADEQATDEQAAEEKPAEEAAAEDTAAEEETPEEAAEAEEEEELVQAGQPSVTYRTHIQTYGWETTWKENGAMSGTQGQSKRLEGIEIDVKGVEKEKLGIRYRTHIQTYGWESAWKENGAMSGTKGESKRLEAIRIELTGKNAANYDVYYCVHAQKFGWLNWAKNGADAGTAGYSYRLEGIKIRILPKNSAAPKNEGKLSAAFYSKTDGPGLNTNEKGVAYNTHVQSFGWQDYVFNGGMAGTSGQSKRLEGIHISLVNQDYSGSIEYRTHIQSIGWQGWRKDGAMSGTSGQSKRLEAIDIRLTGEMAKHYDVYYRVHAQSFGWLNWAKNGESSGTAGFAKRLEGIQVVLVEKGKGAPGNVGGIVSANTKAFLDKTNTSLIEVDGSYAGIESYMKLTGSGSGYHAKIDIHDRHGVAVSFGVQYDGGRTQFLVENIMSHATEAGHQGKNYHFLRSASLGQTYKVGMSWFKDNSLRFYVDGQEIFRTSTTLTPPLYFQVEGSAKHNGDSVNAEFSDVRVKCGTEPYTGIWAEWNDSSFDFFGLNGQVTKSGTVVNSGPWSTNGWATSGISAKVTGTANISAGADWDTCFSYREPRTGETGHPLSGVVMIASKEANYK